jgi:hypothetical protein
MGDDIAYAVHTRTCSFMLDGEGVCRWILSSTGMVPADIRQCIGAQFVACLDLTLEGGLAGELLLGAAALFVKRDLASGKQLLLRTGMIFQVEARPDVTIPVSFADTPVSSRGGDTTPPPPAPTMKRSAQSLHELAQQVIDVQESTVTLTLPLYRAESQVGRMPRLPPPNPPPTLREEARPTRRGSRSR